MTWWNDFLQWIAKMPSHYFWLVEVGAVLLGALILSFIQRIVYNHLMPHLEKTNKMWDDALVSALHKPLVFLIWLFALTYSGDLIRAANHHWKILYAIDPIRHIGIVVFIVWLAIRFMKRISIRVVHPDYKKRPLDQTTVDAVTKLSILGISLFAGLIILQVIGVPVSAVFAFAGGSAVVVGFAAKDLLANFFGGLIIYMDRPFSVGDWIASPDKEIEGTVEHIGWRLTRIRTFDKRPLYIPNSIFSTVAIENPSRMTNRRIRTKFGVRYRDADKICVIVADIEDMLRNHSEIDTRQTLFVKLVEFGNSSLNILVYTFTKTTRWVKFQAIQQDVFLKIIEIVNSHGARVTLSSYTLDIPEPLSIDLKRGTASSEI